MLNCKEEQKLFSEEHYRNAFSAHISSVKDKLGSNHKTCKRSDCVVISHEAIELYTLNKHIL